MSYRDDREEEMSFIVDSDKLIRVVELFRDIERTAVVGPYMVEIPIADWQRLRAVIDDEQPN